MIPNMIELELKPVNFPLAGSFQSIRVAASDGNIMIAALIDAGGGKQTVNAIPIEGGTQPRLLMELDSPFGKSSWGIIFYQSEFALVWTKPGSVTSPLGYRAPDGKTSILEGRYPAGIFQSPRFVRGKVDKNAGITALVDEGNYRLLALFSRALADGDADYVSLPSVGAGILSDGLLVRNDTGYVMIVKLLATGTRGPDRMDRRGESFTPGVLRSMQLNKKLEPIGDVLAPIGDTHVFEFDVDQYEERIFLLGTTDKGSIAATATVTEFAQYWISTLEIKTPQKLVSPSVMAIDKSTAQIAAIESDQASQVMIGRILLQDM